MIKKLSGKFFLFSFFIFYFLFFIPPKSFGGWYSSLILKTDEKITSSVAGGGSVIYAGGEFGKVYGVDVSSAAPVMNYIADLSGKITDMIYEGGILYAVNNNLWRLDPASGFSVEIITNSCSFQSLIKKDDVFYLSDEYGRLWKYDSQTEFQENIGDSALGMTGLAFYEGSLFAASRDGCLYRFYEENDVWKKDKIYKSGTKLYTVCVSSFSGESRLYTGSADSYIREVYYKNDWKIFPVDYTSGGLTRIVPERIRGDDALFALTDGGSIFEFSNSTSGYKKSEILNCGIKINDGLIIGNDFFFWTDDKYLNALYYSESTLPGSGFKHKPSGEISVGNSTTSYRNPLFPKKDEEIIFYFTDSDKAQDLSPKLYLKAESSSTWLTSSFAYKETGSSYSVYFASITASTTLNYSTGTIIEYFISAKGVYISRPGEDKLSNNSNYAFGYSSSSASSKPFTFMLAGAGNCFHRPSSSFGMAASMRTPLYPMAGEEVTFYVGNQASGAGNYGNMTGGAFHYYQKGLWQEKYINWKEDIGDYKYWKASLTLEAPTSYYFSVTYDDHNTTYVFADDDNSRAGESEAEATASPFILLLSTTSFNINLSSPPSDMLNMKIYEAGGFKIAYESKISSFTKVSLPAGNYDLIINGGDYKTIYDSFIFSPSSKGYALAASQTPHSFALSGACEADFSANEKIAADSHSDSKWGITNEIYDLWITFDSENIYIGLKGILKDNSIAVYVDCGDYLGSVEDASGLPWSQSRNHKFPPGFRPDYQFVFWNFTQGSFYRILSATTLNDITSQVSQAVKGGGAGNTGEIELKMPFSVIYDGITSTGVPGGAKIKLLAAVTGGDGTSAKDSVPDQTASFGDTFDEFTFDKWFEIPLDSDGDGFADSGKIINEVFYSTTGVRTALTAAPDSITYENFNKSEYLYEERDMPLYVYSADASTAVVEWKNTSAGEFSPLSPASSASTFTFIIPAESVYGKIDYYFILYKGTTSVMTPVYGITVSPDVKLAPGAKEYFFGESKIVFSSPLGEEVSFHYLSPDNLITDGTLPSNAEIIPVDGLKLPVELYEIKGNIPPASVTLKYFESSGGNYAAYFYDGLRWIYKPPIAVSANTITININQQGKIGIFKLISSPTNVFLNSAQDIMSISKPLFNPSMGEKIEFNFLKKPASLKIEIFDLNSRKIKTISGEAFWDGRNKEGVVVYTGAYIYRLKTATDDFWGMLGVWK